MLKFKITTFEALQCKFKMSGLIIYFYLNLVLQECCGKLLNLSWKNKKNLNS